MDITHTDINKNALYAAFGIPEFWRYDGEVLKIYQLQSGEYQEQVISPTFPCLQKEVFYQFLQQCQSEGEALANRQLRSLVQTQKA